jgi:hypothetical protein
LEGFPSSSTATATFSSGLNPGSVTPDSVRMVDLTDGDGTPVAYALLRDAEANAWAVTNTDTAP